MKNMTLYLPGFQIESLRRKPQTAQQMLAKKLAELKQKTFSQLSKCFGQFIPKHCLCPSESGSLSRQRLFSKENTFWAFLSQVLDADGGCQEVVRKLQAFTAMKSTSLPSSSTAAYCQARKKLDIHELEAILQHTSDQLRPTSDRGFLNGRRVIVVDGTGLSMPDTNANQQVWPQQQNQTPGCSFPQAALCACFCLQTGGLLSYELGNKKSHELPLLRKQWGPFNAGDVFLGDKGFCSFFDVYKFKEKEVDSVITLARRKPVTATEADKVLGEDDLLIHWKKPVRTKASSYSQEDWEDLPDTLSLRQIKVTVNRPGFRVSQFYIITTLTDADTYPAGEIAQLYYQRWDVELYCRDIKTTMGMDILRCKSPDMIRKEILMHLIAYNCIRCLIQNAADKQKVAANQISFKGSIQALRQWEPYLNQTHISRQKQLDLIQRLYESIAGKIIPFRPGRREPRAIKRRPKNYQLLTAHRHEIVEVRHRSKYTAKGA